MTELQLTTDISGGHWPPIFKIIDSNSRKMVLAFPCVLLYSALCETRQKAKSDRSVTDGHGTIHVAGSEAENPFRSHLLNEETVEMYRDLLNRPLPRLPKLYTLPSR